MLILWACQANVRRISCILNQNALKACFIGGSVPPCDIKALIQRADRAVPCLCYTNCQWLACVCDPVRKADGHGRERAGSVTFPSLSSQ